MLARNSALRIVVPLFAVLVGVGCSALGGTTAEDQGEANYRVAVVERGDLRETVSATAPVLAHDRTELTFLLSGRVQEVNVEVGQHVRAGEVLMRIDTAQYELDLMDAEIAVQLQQIALEQLLRGVSEWDVAAASAAVQRAQYQLEQLTQPPDENAIRIAQANLELRRSDLWLAQVNRDQVYQQLGEGYQLDQANSQVASNELAVQIAQQQLINAQQGASSNDIAAAQAAVWQAQATLARLLEGPNDIDVQIARLQIQQAELAVQNVRASLEDAKLVAPFDGIVAQVRYTVGEEVVPGLPAVVLLDDSSFHIDALIDEVDIAKIHVGQLVFVSLDAWPDANVTGHVQRIAPEGVNVGGVVSYSVRILLDPTDVPLRDGMTATVDIVVSELTRVLLIPNWAIRFDRSTGEAYTNILRDDGTVEEIRIEIGVRGSTMSEVRSGLQEGDRVVVSSQREELNLFGESSSGGQ
jgi:HlyD family secretion protein